MKQKVKLWDILRKRIQVDVRQFNLNDFKKYLSNEFKDKRNRGIVKYFSNKHVFDWLKSYVIKQKTKTNKIYYRTKPTRWQNNEIILLKKLAKNFKGDALVKAFNAKVAVSRTKSSILTKKYRLKL